jgi:hypothetical protein
LGKDLLIRGWLNFNPNTNLITEIKSVLYRNQVEEELLKISLLETLSETQEARFSDPDYYKPVEELKS